jgi:3'-5' exonuclease
MFDNIHPENLIFLDIETVPQSMAFTDLPAEVQKLWEKKSAFIRQGEQTPAEVYQKAGIYAEFGKIICISVGLVYAEGGKRKIRIKSFSGKDESQLLREFAALLRTLSLKKNYSLCAHNGKEFDFPYIARRMLVNSIELPAILDTAGKKPWEVGHIDTMELWKFGDYKNYTSLELLTYIFGIPSPKNDIDGSMVAQVFYEDDDLPRIVKYCERDVVAIIQLIMKFRGMELISESDISHAVQNQEQ